MASDVKWIKVSTDLFNDEKIKLIRSMPDGNSVIVVWLQLLLLAGRVNQGGFLVVSDTEIPYTEEMLSTHFDMKLSTVLMAMETFKRFGMIEIIDDIYHITNWAKHQSLDGMEKIRERDKERKREARAKARAVEAAHAVPSLPPAEPKETPLQRRFARFWTAYPKKVGKGAAEKSFAKYKPSDELTDTMIRAVEASKRSAQWQRDGGQYIPNPSTWLNQRRWEDEPLQQAPAPRPKDQSHEDWDGWN